ncbi:hypothetical protein Tco_1119659 [Tanacetum coccineum]
MMDNIKRVSSGPRTVVSTGTSLSILRSYLASAGPDDLRPGTSFDMPASLKTVVSTGTSLSILRSYLASAGPDDPRPGTSFDMPASLKVYFSQLGPPGINKVITFEILCRSLQIQHTVTLLRVFQTLCKQGHWFSFAKRRATSPVCIDDKRSCMKDWKTGFFFIDRRAIPDYMPWRHPDSIITDLKPAAGSYDQQEVRRLSAFIVKLRDMPEGESTKVQEELHHDVRSTLQRLPFYCTPSAAADVVIHDPTPECVAATTPNTKVLAKAEAFKKQKASTFGSALSQVAKHTRSTTSHSSDGSSRPNLFDDHSDDDPDAYVEIPLITLIRSAVTIPLRGSAIRPRDSISPSSSVQDTAGVAIDKEFFLFLPRPYYADYSRGTTL